MLPRHSRFAAAIAALAFSACSPPPDVSDADGIDVPDVATTCGADPVCGAGQLCSFRPGCSAEPVRYCGDNTCGDAVGIYYCGCDGVTFVSGCLHPDRPYAHAGTCEDASAGD